MEKDRLKLIFQKTDGNCHICHKKLSFSNYGSFGSRGAWEIEHSTAKANGGSDHMNNLYAAHISCNRSKSDTSTKAARRKHGVTRAPHSKKKKEKIKSGNTVAGAIIGGLVGSLGGPWGAAAGAAIGGAIGSSNSPKK